MLYTKKITTDIFNHLAELHPHAIIETNTNNKKEILLLLLLIIIIIL